MITGLTEANQRTVAAIVAALSAAASYPPQLLLAAARRSDDADAARSSSVLAAQKSRLSARDLLQRAYNQEPTEKAALFRIIGEIADDVARSRNCSAASRARTRSRARTSSTSCRASTAQTSPEALQAQLRDPNKFIRQAVLNALARLDGNVDVGLLCEVLRDPDVETQQKAIDAVVRANHPDTMQHLVERAARTRTRARAARRSRS